MHITVIRLGQGKWQWELSCNGRVCEYVGHFVSRSELWLRDMTFMTYVTINVSVVW